MQMNAVGLERVQSASFGRWLGPALVFLLLLLAGLLAVWLWQQRLPGEGSAEVTFARDMSAHHLQAVEMAFIIRERSQDEELRRLALDIFTSQQLQVGQMQGWLAAWGQPLSGPEPMMAGHGEMMGMATPEQLNQLKTLPVAEAETTFLQLMIRHHQGGVMMAQEALQQTDRPEVVRLATAIIEAQEGEIDYMQELLQQRGAEPLPPLGAMENNTEHQ
jgi:uncharacterized protein (DUF305 family)